MSLSAKSYNFFLNEYDCKYVRVTLDKWYGNNLVPVLPAVNYMFVHWTADDNNKHWKDIYEVPLSIMKCPCCAFCWKSYGDYCISHMDNYEEDVHKRYYSEDNKRYKRSPLKMTGFDFVTYIDNGVMTDVVNNDVFPVAVDGESIPRRSKRVKRQTEFYYGY
jgi:hypothetical protein